MTIRQVALLIIGLISITLVPVRAWANAQKAWEALDRLEVAKAIELFEAARREDPDDHSLIRGLVLAYHLDGQHEPQIRLIREAIETDPANPYNLALYEHLAANLNLRAEYRGLAKELAESMIHLPPGPMRYCGWMIFDSWVQATLADGPDNFPDTVGMAPAAWISGPYENNSRVAAVRLLPAEDSALDTLSVMSGKDGVRVTWVNLRSNNYGKFYTGAVMENRFNAAVQLRFPFRLDSPREVIMVLGGAFHYRLRIDGTEVAEDRKFSNAVVRDALRISLDAGEHEIMLAAGWENQITNLSLCLLDTLYQPIPDLTWLRAARPQGSPRDSALRVNPIFDSFEAYVRSTGEAPDTRYWRAILDIYNAREAGAVQRLEELNRNDSLSLLEKFCLITALYVNDEAEQAVVHLNQVREQAQVPLLELLWIQASQDDYATVIRKAAKLAQVYPRRPMIEAIATGVPLLEGDIPGFLEDAREFESRFPNELIMKETLAEIYQDVLKDYDAALTAFLDKCDVAQDKRTEFREGPGYYVQARKFDDAMALSRRGLQLMPDDEVVINNFIQSALAAGRAEEAVVFLDSLINVHPTNLDLLSSGYDLYRQTGRHEQARQILGKIHFFKPTAWMPYQQVDSLHNFAPYDSIFTPVDVMSLWDDPPKEEDLKGHGEYTLLDHRQVIIFESGAAYNDIHFAIVLLDKSNVESHQEMDIGFYPSSRNANLLVARRLRKGGAPLAGQHDGKSVYFQDLQPGDAVELHYRMWEAAGGDLWQQYWDEYQTGANIYQQLWEYIILTNRQDCRFASTRPDIEPVVDTHFNFVRTTWREEEVPATDDDPVLAPPHDDIMGKIFVSTLSDWRDIGDWYAAISEAVLDENPRAKQLALQLIQGAEGDREKLHRLYESVVFDIPYQVMDFDYSACVPHSPDEVLVNLWGDCKDKAHLLIAMLREAGIRSWPVLVMTRTNGTHLPIPHMSFNHVIVGCIIEGDTLYVDPSSEPSPPEHSVKLSTAGQPCLHIFPDGGSFAGRIPPIKPADIQDTWTLSIGSSEDEGRYRFHISREFGNLSAGNRRHMYRDVPPAQLIENKESYLSDNWDISMEIDSLDMDSLSVITPVFSDRFSGYMTLSTQLIGNTTIIQPPKWCPFQNSLPTDLFSQGARDYPVDLRYACGDSRFILKFKVPDGYGSPQVPEPARLQSPQLNFDYNYSYDEEAHELTLTYHMLIEDGEVPVETFLEFVKKVLGAFDAPILLQREI